MTRPEPRPEPRPGVRSRAGSFVVRRLADVGLLVAWVVVAFNLAQVVRLEGESVPRLIFSYGALLAIGIGATVLWARTRRR